MLIIGVDFKVGIGVTIGAYIGFNDIGVAFLQINLLKVWLVFIEELCITLVLSLGASSCFC